MNNNTFWEKFTEALCKDLDERIEALKPDLEEEDDE